VPGRGGHRQNHFKRDTGAQARFTDHRQRAAHQAGQALTNGQAQTRARLLVGTTFVKAEIGQEQFGQNLCTDALSGVRNLKAQ
jgi:hypothetical protein